jgi:hypothetical protein
LIAGVAGGTAFSWLSLETFKRLVGDPGRASVRFFRSSLPWKFLQSLHLPVIVCIEPKHKETRQLEKGVEEPPLPFTTQTRGELTHIGTEDVGLEAFAIPFETVGFSAVTPFAMTTLLLNKSLSTKGKKERKEMLVGKRKKKKVETKKIENANRFWAANLGFEGCGVALESGFASLNHLCFELVNVGTARALAVLTIDLGSKTFAIQFQTF